MIVDDVIWQIINQKHCSFKAKTETRTFCRNEYNLTGLCSKPACPLANSDYATVKEIKGKIFLFVKTAERGFLPNRMWEKVELSDNYQQALEEIDSKLEHWNQFTIHKCKQRLTKLRELIRRKRKMRIKGTHELTAVNKYTERRDDIRMDKAEKRLNIDNEIEKELADRLKMGTYGKIYDDIFNLDKKAFKTHLDENELEEANDDFDEDLEELEAEIESENDLEFVFDKEEVLAKREKMKSKKKKIDLELEKEEKN